MGKKHKVKKHKERDHEDDYDGLYMMSLVFATLSRAIAPVIVFFDGIPLGNKSTFKNWGLISGCRTSQPKLTCLKSTRPT